MQKNRGITPVIIFLVVTAFAGLGMLVYSNWPKELKVVPEVKNSVVLDETKDWKTYRNEKYGFEFKYPKSNKSEDFMIEKFERGEMIRFRVDQSRIFAVEIINKNPNCPDTAAAADIPNKIIDGIDFVGVGGHQIGEAINIGGYTFPYGNADSYCALVNGLEYKILMSTTSRYDEKIENPRTDPKLRQILSTFKFIPQKQNDEVSNWKTYRNEKYGFELRYPSKYKIENYSKDSDVYFVDSEGKRIHLEVESKDGTFCIWGLCQKEKIGSISKNGIIWEDLGLNKYCDVGQCSGNQRVYRIVYLDNRFNIISGLTDKQTEEEFLSNFKFIDKNPTSEKPVSNLKLCFVGGCSGELCLEAKDSGMASTCEWKEEYACYKKTKCERQQTGKCGWTETPEFKSCLANPLPKQ